MNPLISVIVPCYNQAQYLSEALQSVLEQSYTNWECIIVNDGSPDNTHQVAKEWLVKDSRFKYIQKNNGGLSSARNAGIESAMGEFIQFLDCDDIIEIEKFSVQIKIFEKLQNVDVLISGYRYFLNKSKDLRIQGDNKFYPEVLIDKSDSSNEVLDLMLRKNPFVASAPLYRKNALNKIGKFDESLPSLEDWDFNLRAALNEIKYHHIGYIPNTKTLIRLHGESMMKNKKVMFRASELINEKQILYQNQFPNWNLKLKPKIRFKKFKKIISLILPPIVYKIKKLI